MAADIPIDEAIIGAANGIATAATTATMVWIALLISISL
jgi:hypothetical protein